MSTNSRTSSLQALALGALGLLGGCLAGGDTDTCLDCEEPSPPISARGVVECFVRPSHHQDELVCRFEPPSSYPVRLSSAAITGRSSAGDSFRAEILATDAGHERTVARISPEAYPLVLDLDINLDPSDRTVPALQGVEYVRHTAELAAAEDADETSPVRAEMPFDLWHVELFGRDANYSTLSFEHAISLGDRVHDLSFSTRPLLFGQSEQFFIPVSGTDVTAKLLFEDGEARSVALAGAGSYVVKDHELAVATNEDRPHDQQGSALGICWFEAMDHGYEALYCQSTFAHGLELSSARILVETANGERYDAELGAEPGFVRELPADAFPIELSLRGALAGDVRGLEALVGDRVSIRRTLDAKMLPRYMAPEQLRAPFFVWEVDLEHATEGFAGTLDPYVLELGSAWQGRFAAMIPPLEMPSLEAGETAHFSIAAPVGVDRLIGTGFTVVDGQAREIGFEIRHGRVLIRD